MKLSDYIVIDPAICHGKACIKGTRVLVSVIPDNLAAGATAAEIQQSYPAVSTAAIPGAFAYAAELSHERVLAVSA
jgi:uncharacterized protein (DUF433 family)